MDIEYKLDMLSDTVENLTNRIQVAEYRLIPEPENGKQEKDLYEYIKELTERISQLETTVAELKEK